MKSTLWWLGLIFGTLSMVMLLKDGFDYHFAEPLNTFLRCYEIALQGVFGLVEPWIKDWLAALAAWVGWTLQLFAHWKHIFVLMWLYFGATVRVAWSAKQHAFAAFALVWGTLIALSTGVAVGTVALEPNLDNRSVVVLLVSLPIAGYTLFELGNQAFGSWWLGGTKNFGKEFARFARYPHVRLGFGLGAIAAATLAHIIPYMDKVPNPGLAMLIALVVILAGYWIWRGWVGSLEVVGDRYEDEHRPGTDAHYADPKTWPWRKSRWEAFLVSSSARLGFGMSSTIAGATLFVLADLGLKLAGL